MRTADVLRRIEAWRGGAPVPVGETLPWPRLLAEDRLIVAFVRMSGEARPWGVAAGRPGAEPAILTAAEPRDAGELSRLALDLARILLPHLPHPDHATETERAALAEVAARRQLWMPGPTHVEMLHLLDYRFSRANAREDADARELAKLGRAAGWLFRESTRPGQVRVLDATARLREAFAFPAEDVRQQHLGFLLAWLETTGPREARMAAAHAAERLSVGVTMHPSYEEKKLVPLVERWNARRDDVPAQVAVAAQIREVLAPELLRRFRLAEQAIAALEGGGRLANPELGPVLALGAEELVWQYWSREQKAAAPVTDPDAPRFFGDHPETDFLPTHAAARFFAHAHASEMTSAELLHGDRHLVEEAIDRGDAIEGVIRRVVNAGTKRAVVPVWTVVAPAGKPLRLREESPVCVVGLRGRTGKVRTITVEGDERTVEVEIDGWKRARPDDGAPAADAKELEGTRVVLANAGVVGISKRKSMSVWDASGPGAWLTHAAPPPEPSISPPVVGDLVDLVDALSEAPDVPQDHLAPKRRAVLAALLAHVEQRRPLLILKAPPGSGKTYVTMRAIALAAHRKQRVAVATPTNAQADDLCRRMAREFPRVPVIRYASAARTEVPLGASVSWARAAKELPDGPVVVVATTSKWAASVVDPPYDFLFVDEAWQTAWADFMTLSSVAPRFVLVGDPGQIPPVVAIDVARWQTSRRPPHAPAPAVILRDRSLPACVLELPVTTRLPHDTAAMVRTFYDFDFDSWAAPGERRLEADGAGGDRRGVDGALDRLSTGSVVVLALPTPDAGPPLEEDVEVAEAAAAIARRILERGATVVSEAGARALEAKDVGLTATHRVMNTRMTDALGPLAQHVRVDTPERWQGLERELMIAVHPLSGVVRPSAFDLSTGRLCVMASRHRSGLVLVTRDHLPETLAEYLPVAEQAVGLPDDAGRGHWQNLAVWEQLARGGRVVLA